MQWKRQYRVEFPDLGYTVDALRVSFQIEKDLTSESNKASIRIYNMSPENRAKVEAPDVKVNMYAGYEMQTGPVQLFSGTVTQAFTRDDGADVVTELRVSDGQMNLRDSVISVSYSPGTSGKTVVEDVANRMGFTVVFGENVTFSSYPDGFSFVGYGRNALDEVCNASGISWSVQNGILQVILAGGTTGVRGLVFAPDSGLVGSPERIIKANSRADNTTPKRTRKQKSGKEKPEKQAGWTIVALLAPTVIPGDLVKVESRMVTGWMRVESLRHSGDSHGGRWVTEMDLIERGKASDEQ